MRLVTWSNTYSEASPADNANLILGTLNGHQGLAHFGFSSTTGPGSQGRLANFGMGAGVKLLTVKCRILDPPRIYYAGDKPETVDRALWNLNQTQFYAPATVRWIPVLDLSEPSDAKSHKLFVETLLPAMCGKMTAALKVGGLTTSEASLAKICRPKVPAYEFTSEYEEAIRGLFKNSEDQTVLIVLAKKDFEMYATVKRVADLLLGIHTVCLTANNIYPDAKNIGFDQQKAANLAMKFNIKGGGHNHVVSDSDLGSLRDRDNDGDVDAIVLGADVAHPTNGAVPGCPSIACVVGTIDNEVMQFPGSMRLQPGRQEGIEELQDMVFERLHDWAMAAGGKLPKRMLFYRDGVSESQYDIVRQKEIPQIQAAYSQVRDQLLEEARASGEPAHPSLPPKDESMNFQLTFVVVGKRHNTRFYPLNEWDSFKKGRGGFKDVWNGNVRPGLVVDQVITHPYAMDFFLQSHNPIQGTGRSAHYYVLQNQINFDADELQKITHSFCYSYARATRGVSYCAPAYYADRLCDRGRAYLRHWLMHRNDDAWKASRSKNRNESMEDYRKFVCAEIVRSPHYRPNAARQQYGRPRMNPWHPNLDGVMFYL